MFQALSWIKERVLAKLEGWKGNLHNQVGKEVLIKVVVQTIPSYVMYIVRLPKTLHYKNFVIYKRRLSGGFYPPVYYQRISAVTGGLVSWYYIGRFS